jgi:hypothetical protein
VSGISAEFKNVIQRQTDVLQQLPGCVGRAVGLHATPFNGEAIDGAIKIKVGLMTPHGVQQLGAQRIGDWSCGCQIHAST